MPVGISVHTIYKSKRTNHTLNEQSNDKDQNKAR